MFDSSEELFRNLISRLKRDTLRYIPAAVLPAGFSIVGVYIFTRIFDPLNYGRYALVIAAATIMTSILSGWIQQSVLRYLPRFKADGMLPEFIMKLFILLKTVSISILIISIIVYYFWGVHLDVYNRFLLPAILLILSEIVFLNMSAAFQADLKSKMYSLCKIMNSALRLLLAVAFVLFIRRDIVGLIVGAAAANLLIIIPMMKELNIFQNIRFFFKYIDLGFMKMFAAYGLPMVGWMLCGQILGISDRFIIGAIRGSSEVGIYSANYNLVGMGFNLVSGPILTASYPLIITAWEKGDKEKITAVISEFSKYYLLAILPVVTFIAVFSREIVSIVLGNEFREGYTIIPFVLGGISVWGLAMIGHKGLEILEKTRIMLVLVTASACLNILLNLILIPKYGYNGAAVATFLSYLAYPVLAYRATKYRIPWHMPWRSVGKVLLASILMGAIMFLLKYLLQDRIPVVVGLTIAGVIGLLVYAGLIFLLKETREFQR